MCNSCPSLLKPSKRDSCSRNSGRSESTVRYSAKCLPGTDVRSDSLGQSVRPLCGAWYHNVFTADCRSGCHSTKCASCSPPLRRASIGNGRTASHGLTRFYWTTDRSICIRLREPRELCMNGRICSHSWIIDIHTLSHSLTRTQGVRVE